MERFHFLTGLSEAANRIGQFVLAARGRLQFRCEIENAWPKGVKAGVIPGASWFAWFRFFAKVDKEHFVIEKHGATFTNVFAARDRQECLDIIWKIDHAFVIRGIN